MAIYPDKKNGELTGRFRVELQKGKDRYRKRWDSYKEAQEDEKRVQGLWASGQDATAPVPAPAAPEGITIQNAYNKLNGVLWKGTPSEELNWAHVRLFVSLAGPDTLVDAVTSDEVRKVIAEIERRGRKPSTVNRYLSHIKVFLDRCVEERLRTVPVAGHIKFDFTKETGGRVRWLSFEEEERLISLVPDAVGKLIRVALATGCRREELMNLKPSHIIGNTLYLWKTKNDQPREVPMTPEVTALVTDLVVNGTMPSKRTLRRHWDKAKSKMGLSDDDNFVFHACRHTCATRMLDAGVDVLVIKEWLGHKRIETTQRYTHVKSKNKVDALAMVGEMSARARQEAQKTWSPTAPHPLPHGGENDEMPIAA